MTPLNGDDWQMAACPTPVTLLCNISVTLRPPVEPGWNLPLRSPYKRVDWWSRTLRLQSVATVQMSLLSSTLEYPWRFTPAFGSFCFRITAWAKSKSHYDWRSVSKYVLVSSPLWDLWPIFFFFQICCFVSVGSPLWREVWSVFCQSFVSTVYSSQSVCT
jgi:hypothetical protein